MRGSFAACAAESPHAPVDPPRAGRHRVRGREGWHRGILGITYESIVNGGGSVHRAGGRGRARGIHEGRGAARRSRYAADEGGSVHGRHAMTGRGSHVSGRGGTGSVATCVDGEGASKPFAENVVVGLVPVPMPPTLAATGQTILGEASPWERPASLGDSEGPSRVLVHVGSEPHTWGGPGSGGPRGRIPSRRSSPLMIRRRQETGALSS